MGLAIRRLCGHDSIQQATDSTIQQSNNSKFVLREEEEEEDVKSEKGIDYKDKVENTEAELLFLFEQIKPLKTRLLSERREKGNRINELKQKIEEIKDVLPQLNNDDDCWNIGNMGNIANVDHIVDIHKLVKRLAYLDESIKVKTTQYTKLCDVIEAYRYTYTEPEFVDEDKFRKGHEILENILDQQVASNFNDETIKYDIFESLQKAIKMFNPVKEVKTNTSTVVASRINPEPKIKLKLKPNPYLNTDIASTLPDAANHDIPVDNNHGNSNSGLALLANP
jgi:hypothetical protein